MPIAGENALNGAQINGAHTNNTTKLRFDTIEDTIKAFSKFLYILSAAFLPQQVLNIFSLRGWKEISRASACSVLEGSPVNDYHIAFRERRVHHSSRLHRSRKRRRPHYRRRGCNHGTNGLHDSAHQVKTHFP